MEWLKQNLLQIITLTIALLAAVSGWATAAVVLYKARSDKKKTDAEAHKTITDSEKAEAEAQKTEVDTIINLIREIEEIRVKWRELLDTQIAEKNLLENTKRLLQQVEIVLREFLNNSHIGYWEADSMGKRNYFNDVWLEMAGMRLSEAVGDGWQNCIHPDDREMVRRRDEMMTLAGSTLRPIRCRIINQKTGEEFYVEKTLFVVFNTDHTIYKFIGRMVKV
ncbi:MAG: PAS domain-containing protein [Pyrinomonadaceae bacterium]